LLWAIANSPPAAPGSISSGTKVPSRHRNEDPTAINGHRSGNNTRNGGLLHSPDARCLMPDAFLPYDSLMDPARIIIDPGVLAGKPVVRGTRLAVEFVVGLLAQGWSEAEILANYPGLTHHDVLACLDYAHRRLSEERIYPLSA
jgi:uncharacterized protein (DUF433 family)